MSLGKNLRRILDEQRISVAQLAHKTEIPVKTLYHWLAGQQPRKIEHLFRLCDTLNLTIEELYNRPKGRPHPLTAQQLEDEIHAGAYEIILRPLKVPRDAK
ncbi:Helix-turn-helix domain protein [compost metagenome]